VGFQGGCVARCGIPWSFTSPVAQVGEKGGKRDESREVNPMMCREGRAAQGPGLGAAVSGAAWVPWVRSLALTRMPSWIPGTALQATHVSKALSCFGNQIATE